MEKRESMLQKECYQKWGILTRKYGKTYKTLLTTKFIKDIL